MLFVELDLAPRFDFSTLLVGGDGLDRSARWLAYAPHLDVPEQVSLAQLAALEQAETDAPGDWTALVAAHGEDVLQPLLDAGLLVAGKHEDTHQAARDAAARSVPWWPPALLAHNAGTWDGVDIEARREAGLMPSAAQMVDHNGPAPDAEHVRAPGVAPLSLPVPRRTEFDSLLAQRRTCRNFDADAVLAADALSTLLHRVWGAVGTRELAPGAVAVKKTSPAGGGLHAVEAYLLVQRAEGLAPGFYHYLPLRHALEPLTLLDAAQARATAHRFVGGQAWFVDAPVMVVMTARFDRLFWKYRRHPKAWRVAHLDVGHLSQTMYLSAADQGLGAFVTAAINDRDIERALDLAPLTEAALAIVGFGRRSEQATTIELDQLVPTAAARAAAGD